jgi:SAM-dependent methyltransferase
MEYIDRAGMSDRISVASGYFFTDDPFPGPVDYILFSNIFHDWPDEINLKLIEKAYNCLSPGGKIVISELLLSDDVKSSTSSATSMNVIMMPYTKGRQYRPKELFRRLKRAGFVDPHVTKLVDDYDLVIATKP